MAFNRNTPTKKKPRTPSEVVAEHEHTRVSGDLDQLIKMVDAILGQNEDFVERRFNIFGKFPAVMFYFSDMVAHQDINMEIMKPLMYVPKHLADQPIEFADLKDVLASNVLHYGQLSYECNIAALIESLMVGSTVIAIQDMGEAVVVSTRNIEKRSITQPQTEQVIRGPREGFIEQLSTNIGLMRYRLQTPDFRVKTLKVGRLTKSKVVVCYIDGIANPALVDEVERRLSEIKIDGVLDVGYLEQFIEDNHFSPFPQVQNTERPDKAVANLMEGRVIIMVDGSPFGLIVPSVFTQFYQTVEDYSERFLMVSFVRLARLVALVFSLVFPALYVAVISFNPELIPTEFAVAVAGGRAGVPWPSVIEVLIMEVTMEVLREATLRLPQQVGGALSIVGVLVVGQAAVSAGFTSPITVVIIALTTIGSFATPAYNAALALRLLRFPLIIMAGMFGLYGVMVGLIFIINHVLSLKSFGVPYMSPIVPGNFEGMKDTAARWPLWSMFKRPAMLHTGQKQRVGDGTMKAVNDAPVNTLDPLKVGNDRREIGDGESASDHDDSGGGHSD
ncbi:spore germination protein [Paenibacillus humicola]|uniref:spore germination protein n=1 Tax=Paenibacillus humicola TaxID=3110540 RepID=UPI00237B25E7|nr:spore germination protein [Paenibacillus humicola]